MSMSTPRIRKWGPHFSLCPRYHLNRPVNWPQAGANRTLSLTLNLSIWSQISLVCNRFALKASGCGFIVWFTLRLWVFSVWFSLGVAVAIDQCVESDSYRDVFETYLNVLHGTTRLRGVNQFRLIGNRQLRTWILSGISVYVEVCYQETNIYYQQINMEVIYGHSSGGHPATVTIWIVTLLSIAYI